MSKGYQSKRTVLIVCLGLLLLLAVLGLTINPKADTYTAYAWGEDVVLSDVNEDYLQWDYLNLYQIKPKTHFSYSSTSDGYSGHALDNAFDGNFDTTFVSTRTISYNATVQINAVFNKVTTVDRIIYKCASYNGKASGFPTYLRLSWGNGSYNESTSLQTWGNAPTGIVMFTFSQPITTDRIKFEFAEVSTVDNNVSGTWNVATAAELMFLQPENEYVDKVGDLFADYRWTELKPQYQNAATLNAMKEQLSGYINYGTEFGPRIERALALLDGTVEYDSAREFSTDGYGLNKIEQWGNMIGYAQNTLKMNYMGSNKQVTGIYQNANKTITVWVDAPEGAPLPSIAIEQYKNHYWNLKDTYTLNRGRNVIIIPNNVARYQDLYKNFTVSGGAVYIINPYTPQQQESAKIYIEGGYRFPVLTYDTPVAEYRAQLAEYVQLVNEHPNDYADITELVANHAILTFPAGKANGYYQSSYNPRNIMESWDATIEEMFAFDGIALYEHEDHYDERNKHLYVNVRTVQPATGAAAYAYGEMIGLPDFLDNAMIASFGWGITHEIGHTIDLPDRMLSETTNNVPTKYYEVVHGNISRGSFADIRNSLTSDLVDTSDFWKGHTGYYEFWWDIESVLPGYWARLENLYRFESRQNVNDKTELLVYFSSLATGQDMCYYFERWGFSFNTAKPFKYDSASQNFKNAMQAAKTSGKIGNEQYKFWYVDKTVYTYVALEHGKSLYDTAFTPAIDSIVKVGGGYKIVFPKVADLGHLGYEILQGNAQDGYKVIAFADGDSYIDTTSYPAGYAPSYKIVAYDKTLHHSSESAAVTVQTTVSNPVCKVNNINYGSLRDAMFAASNGDTIYLLTDAWDIDIDVTFNVTIAIDQSVSGNITITKGGNGVLFNLRSGARLTLQGSADHKLILDGDSYGGGALVNANGATITASHVKFTNCKSSGEGGAIAVNGGTLTLDNCEFENCIASVGGAIYALSATATIDDCSFDNCHAVEGNASGYANGGALYLADCASVTITSTTIVDCSADVNSGQSISNGGAMYVKNCANVTLNGTTISGCNANYGGGIYLVSSALTVQNSSSITYCSAVDGGAVYVADSSTLTITRATLTDNTATGNGGAVFVDATSSLSVNNLSTLSKNTATNYGGAIAAEGTITQIVGDTSTSLTKRMLMEYNTAQFGGAIALINGAKLNAMQNVTLRYNEANYGAAMYIEGSAWLKDDVMITLNTASQFGGGIYYKGDANSELKFTSKDISGRTQLYNDTAPIGYELYMESGNLQLIAVNFFFNYVQREKMPTEDEMKYSLYVNSGNVTIAGTATPTGGAHNLDAELTRDIFLSQNATVHLTTAMFTVQPFYGAMDMSIGKYPTYTSFHITLDSYDFDYVHTIFTADFDIPANTLMDKEISFLNLDESKGTIEIRGNKICYVPKQVKLTLDYGEDGVESFLVDNGSAYTFTAQAFEAAHPDKYIISFIVDGVTYHAGDSIDIYDMTVVQVVVGQKYKVTISYGDNEEIIYVTPGEKFTFPSSSSAVNGNIIKWEYNGNYYNAGDQIDVDGDIVILPIKEGSKKVEFYVGTDLFAVKYVDDGGSITMPALTDIAQGYELLGWYAGDVLYEVGATVKITADVTFVAHIAKMKFIVAYYNGLTLISSLEVEFGAALNPPTPVREGYKFTGWLKDDVLFTQTFMPAENLILTASWVMDLDLFTAKLDTLKNATSLEAKFTAIKDIESLLEIWTDEDIKGLDLAEYNALKAAFDGLSAVAQGDLAVAEKVGESLTAKFATVVALFAVAVAILKRRILG